MARLVFLSFGYLGVLLAGTCQSPWVAVFWREVEMGAATVKVPGLAAMGLLADGDGNAGSALNQPLQSRRDIGLTHQGLSHQHRSGPGRPNPVEVSALDQARFTHHQDPLGA